MSWFDGVKASLGLLLGAGRLLGQEDGLDVGQDAALGDGDPGQQLVQLLIVPGPQVKSGPEKRVTRTTWPNK